MSKKQKSIIDESGHKVIATNRKARRDYTVLDRFEAGIVLQGTEVKSIRAGHLSLDESFARIEHMQVWLQNLHILPYEQGNRNNHEPRRPRRLLLHKREIQRLYGQATIKGLTLVPLRMYFKRGKVKVEIGLCKGKHQQDKRESLKRKTADLEARRAMAHATRR